MEWISIGLIIGAAFLFFKFSNLRYERVWTYSIALILIFFLFSFFSVVSHNGVDISDFDGLVQGTKFYMQWLVGWASHTAKITGSAIDNFDWSANYSNSSG